MMNIRTEQEGDHDVIYALTQSAFAGREYAGGDEGDVINALRRAGALSLSLVMEQDGEIIGQVTFSPAQTADGADGWFALGPVALVITICCCSLSAYSTRSRNCCAALPFRRITTIPLYEICTRPDLVA